MIADVEFSPEEIAQLLTALPTLPRAEAEQLLLDLEALDRKRKIAAAKTNFLAFCHYVYPNFKEGPHHRHMAPLLEELEAGTKPRLTVSMPPRFGKSETIAYLFVSWHLGHNPGHQIMMVTHTADLSADFGRKVRNMLDSDIYHEIFPDTCVAKDKSAASNWSTTLGGKYLAIGVGANVAGHGADLLIGDDLVSEQAVLASDPDKNFAHAWEYMQVGPLQRLMPNGRIIMIGCMTAETRVLMADGSEKEIQHIEVGDRIATYDNGAITTSRVTNWIEHHPDFVYKIRTTSGKIVRANERHPFLVDRNGERTWVRVRNLKVGDCLVEAVQAQDASALTKPRGCASSATHASSAPTDGSVRAVPDTGENGRGLLARSKAAAVQFLQKVFATVATARRLGVQASTVSRKSKNAPATSSTGTGFLQRPSTLWSNSKAACAPSASSHLPEKTQGLDERQSSTSITVTTPTASVGYSATTATSQSDTRTQKSGCGPLPSTYVSTASAIVELVEDGFEPVYDMEVERTENFIANGVVSHNTRWGKKDPIGRALAWAEQNPDSLPWHEVRFPALMPSGKSLWPEQWPVEQLLAKKAGMQPQFWAAQYMQAPTSEEGALLKRDWWKVWEKEDPPDVEFVLQVWDTAHDNKSHNDFSACTTWGVWFNEETNRHELLLLNAVKDRWEFPQLKKKALEHYKEWEPECLLIEKKAAGAPLIQELRQMDIIVEEYSPSRGKVGVSNDKRARVNAVAPILFDGIVWAPDFRWAHEVVNECAEYPNGEHDDYVDCVAMALSRYRRGGFIFLQTDRRDEVAAQPRRAAYY